MDQLQGCWSYVLSHLTMSATRLEIVIFDGNLLFYGAPERFMDRCVFFVSFLVMGYLLECTSARDSVTAGAGGGSRVV